MDLGFEVEADDITPLLGSGLTRSLLEEATAFEGSLRFGILLENGFNGRLCGLREVDIPCHQYPVEPL